MDTMRVINNFRAYRVNQTQYKEILRLCRGTVARQAINAGTDYKIVWEDVRGKFSGRYHYMSAESETHARTIAEFRRVPTSTTQFYVTIYDGRDWSTDYFADVVKTIVESVVYYK